MACPDELTLDLWSSTGALPSDEAAEVAAHVRTCPTCAAAVRAAKTLDGELHTALTLDAEELAYLSGLELASTWRTSSASAALSWSWIALAGVVAGFAAWFVAAPVLGTAVAAGLQIGLGTVLLSAVLSLVFSLGQALPPIAIGHQLVEAVDCHGLVHAGRAVDKLEHEIECHFRFWPSQQRLQLHKWNPPAFWIDQKKGECVGWDVLQYGRHHT